MAGNARFESPSASASEPGFSGAYSNGKRGTHSAAAGPNLDRSGSFREGAESRMFSSGIAVSRGGNSATVTSGNLPPLSQCLSLEPIVMGERKVDRSVELKKVMGLFVESTAEESSSGAAVPANSKPAPPVAVAEDLKRFRLSVADTCITARGRASKLDEHLHKLDKYCDGVISKKPQRNELVTNEQVGALNSKTGTQIYRNPTELVNQRVEDRPKNVLMNKRVRTSVAETRAEFRSNGVRRQPVAMAKDRDSLKDNGGESDMLEEKIQRLPAGGEGWDKKMKRKRSVGTVFTRPTDSNGEQKRVVQNKVVSENGLQSNDIHPYRLGASNGTGSTSKLDGTSLPNSSRARLSPRNEPDGSCLPRDLTSGSNKEKVLTKGINKLNTRDDNYTACLSSVTKGKASRNPRNGAMVAASSAPSTPRVSGTPETSENVTGASKIASTGGASNRKRAMPSASSSPSMAQWVGQRPQKMSRTRRANLVSPVSNQEDKQLSSDSCSHSDISVRLPSDGTNGSLVSKHGTGGPQQQKPKLEHAQSPNRLSESEESGGGESKLKDKGKGNSEADANDGQNVGPVAVGVKIKPVINEENGEGVRRQGRSGRGPLIARASSSLAGEKLESAATPKPVQNNRPGCEKNRSKLGRPLKKLSERKGFSRLGHLQNGSESTGKSDDDREELLAAANHARNASYLACSSIFWKKMEPIFASVSSKDKFYLSMQLKPEQDIHESVPQLHGRQINFAVNLPHEASVYNTHSSGERNVHVKHQGSEFFSGKLESEKTSREFIPLFQRVLSALIIEDNIDELEEETENIPLQDSFCDSAYDTFHVDDYDPRKRARREIERDNVFAVHAPSIHSVKVSFSSNGSCTNSFRSPTSVNGSPCEDVRSQVEVLAGISKNFLDRPQVFQMEGFGISSFDSHYEQMRLEDKLLLELQSIGLYPDSVPNLDDKEDEAIKHEIDQLKIRLRQQNGKKKAYLDKICKRVGSCTVRRDLEQVAIDRLVELAYRKLLATRGAARAGIQKIPKHVALAFGRRTLARCRKFGKSGISCFSVPPLRDILFAPQEIELEPTTSVANTTTTTKYLGFRNPHQDSRLSSDEAFAINGPISNRGRKKELLLDDVGTVLGGTTGKRYERDVAKAGYAYHGERKTKPKPKQKAAQPPASGNGFANQFPRTLHPVQPSTNGPHNSGDNRRDVRLMNQGHGPQETSIDPLNLSLQDLDPMDELGVGADLGGPQDLSSLLNFDEEELQDHYSAGLEIPMDDLSELNMF
ncbi:hypothetical protein OSB04_026650 [Centaurea solstitialis]|uniref:Uncharacterized protein n=1 Tax=Centaurea solstitialis TaxID=347529 RepID=A0AA38SDM7_9ASTR|nr:hypothetical protein OSB04_026650 [Centaurea solstitialis]